MPHFYELIQLSLLQRYNTVKIIQLKNIVFSIDKIYFKIFQIVVSIGKLTKILFGNIRFIIIFIQ